MATPSNPKQERWQEAGTLFLAALDQPEEARAAWLASACADAPSLHAEVASLLAAFDEADDFLEDFTRGPVAALIEEASRPEPVAGRQVGPYRLVREIAHGGMGAVYLATRGDGQFEQEVALKLVRRGMSTEAVLHRFQQERQILAWLQHEGIARLFGGGVTEDGQPYFVMEFVEGRPITDYCDAQRLSVSERLRLFLAVGEAVRYAHQNLVVHRDLKPSNIFVTAEGHVKLLDFGIAKMLSEGDEALSLTQTGARMMTPEYAAPEQVRGLPVTTATDVYSLGVVLYELLTGHRPYRFDRPSLVEVERVVCEHEPERLSTAVGHVEEVPHRDGTTETITPQQVSEARATQPDRLRRRLRGDLDTIVQKALRKEPERRYSSTDAFLDDIQRHLEGFPIAAKRDAIGYRMRKFVGRHQVGVGAAALVLLTLLAGLAGTVWQARIAAQEARKAEEVKTFLVSLFEKSDPATSSGMDVTAREMLDEGASRIKAELAGQPEVQAEMMSVIGEIYVGLDVYDKAEPLLDQALALRRGIHGPSHPDVAASLDAKASLLAALGKRTEAERLYRDALALRRKLLGPSHPDVAETLTNLALLLYRGSVYSADEAEAGSEVEVLYQEALAILRRHYGEEHTAIANALNGLGLLYHEQGRYDEAEVRFREALDLQRKTLGPDHLDTATAMNNLALILYEKGDLARAESLYAQVLAFDLERLGENHLYTATVTNNLAMIARERGDYETAVARFRKVVEIDRLLLGDEHRYVAVATNNLAAALREQGELGEAERLSQKALGLLKKLMGAEHRDTGSAHRSLAMILHEKGDLAGAEVHYRQSLGILTRTLPPGHTTTARTLVGLGRLLTDQGQAQKGEALLREAMDIDRKAYGDEDRRTAQAKLWLGTCLEAQRRYDEARVLLDESYRTLVSERGEHHPLTQQARQALTKLQTEQSSPPAG